MMSYTRILFLIIFGVLTAFAAKTGWEIHEQSKAVNALKDDYAEINRINYGLFNIPLWKEKIFDIVEEKIQDFRISEDTYDDLGGQVEGFLYQMYADWFESGKLVDEIYENLSKSGKINKMLLKLFKSGIEENMGQLNIKGQIPQMADQITTEIRKNEPAIRQRLQEQLVTLLLEGRNAVFRDPRIPLYRKYAMEDAASTTQYLHGAIASAEGELNTNIRTLYIVLLLMVLLCIAAYFLVPFREMVLGLTVVSIVMLVLGVTLPMMDIDARLNGFNMDLFEHQIEFDEQIMYFQSKSILDVTETLWQGQGVDLKIVAALIFLFSIVFPFFKLLLSTLYLYWQRARASRFAQTVIFYLGKWSMADVFVVAMFMAYIGFYGLVTSQLGEISRNPTGYAVETLNYSKLAPGALFFTSYCILSIITSLLIRRKEMTVV